MPIGVTYRVRDYEQVGIWAGVGAGFGEIPDDGSVGVEQI